MKKIISNIILYIIVFVIILASFIIPDILLKMQKQDIQVAVYKKDNSENNNSISVEAEKIYLVKAIHDIESENTEVIISSNETSEKILTTNDDNASNIADIKEEMAKLKENNIIKNFETSNNSKTLFSIVNKVCQKEKIKYTINNISLNIDNNNFKIDIEEKTGKIITIIMKKDNLNDKIEKREILESYIQYLDLYIIDDWVYENNVMKSQKANLAVTLVESVNDGVYMLSVHSNSKMSNNLIEYQNIEN